MPRPPKALIAILRLGVLHQVFEGLAGKVSDPKEQVAVGVFVGDGAPQQGNGHPQLDDPQRPLRRLRRCGNLLLGCDGLRHRDHSFLLSFPTRDARPVPRRHL
jgi:hypothetical protein